MVGVFDRQLKVEKVKAPEEPRQAKAASLRQGRSAREAVPRFDPEKPSGTQKARKIRAASKDVPPARRIGEWQSRLKKECGYMVAPTG